MIDKVKFVLFMVGILTIGSVAGYYYGNAIGFEAGIEQGREDILAEQSAEKEAALAEIQKASNPFADDETDSVANPFKDVYVNPFAQ